MRWLVGCESSGRVRDALLALGHDAWSCDLETSEVPGPHLQMDVREALDRGGWDRGVFFPPCTYLAASGARWWVNRRAEQQAALVLVAALMQSPFPWALENPIGRISTAVRKPDQIIQPWQFGHGETKATCLWLHGLPPLRATEVVKGRLARIHLMGPSPQRSRDRSRTYPGIAVAMAAQWGGPV